MENASKALIIAGAILLSIAIIGIGMYVYQQASGAIGKTNMSQQEVAAYNAEFDKYLGTQTGTAVKSLLQSIRTHNLTADDESKQILVNTTGTPQEEKDLDVAKSTSSTELSNIEKSVRTGTKYNVAFGYSSSGMIKEIVITGTGITGGGEK